MAKPIKVFLWMFLGFFIAVLSVVYFCYDFATKDVIDLSNYSELNDNVSMTNLHVDIDVSNENIVYVTETFDMTFNRSSLTEVVRYVPYYCKTYRIDENGKVKEDVLIAKISDIDGHGDEVDGVLLYEDEIEGYVTIGLKSYSYIPYGETRSYSISYTYDMGKDRNKGYDDIYYNIVGTNSLLTIKNISFSITLPTEISEAKDVKIYTGEFGSEETISFSQSGNLITGTYDKLGPLEGITLRAIYGDGFLKHKATISVSAIIAIMVACVILTLSIICFVRYKQRHKIPVPVELIAPTGITPLKAEYFDKTKCSTTGIIGSIITLASRGYLRINEKEDKEIELIKTQDIPDTEDYSLRALHKALFKKKDVRTLTSLGRDVSFADAQIAITLSEKAKGEKSLYDKNSNDRLQKTKKAMSALMIAFGVLFIFAITAHIGFFGSSVAYRVIVNLGLLLAMLIVMFVGKKTLVIELVLTAIAAVFLLFFYLKGGLIYIDGCLLLFVGVIIIGVATALSGGEGKYSEQGAKKKGSTLGFKNFIKMCEVAQIKAFAEENPTYYFDVLPYAYVFGLSDVWIKKFEGLEVMPPEWATYNGSAVADFVVFNSIYNRFSVKAYNASSSAQTARIKAYSSSSSSGGFSGGGFSGGGSGGFSGGGGGGGGFGAR